jgi:hypothetical protein
MQKTSQIALGAGEWVTVRDFVDDGDGFTLPKYEAKLIEDVDRPYVEDDVVLLKKTSPINGTEHLSHLPKAAFEGVTERL